MPLAVLVRLPAQRFSQRNVYSTPYLRSGLSHGHVSGLKLAWLELTYTTAPGVPGLGLGLILLAIRLPDAPLLAVSLWFSVIYL